MKKTNYLIFKGFHLELVRPTMSILAANIKVTYSDMGSVLASRSAGYLVANILGAVLQNIVKNHSEGLLFCVFILPTIMVFATPFVISLLLMCVLSFTQGLSKSLTDLDKSTFLNFLLQQVKSEYIFLGANNLLLRMWGDNAAAPLNSVHLECGLGAVFVNLLVRPFITQKVLSINVTNHEGVYSTSSILNATKVNPSIVIPYSITEILCFLTAVGHIFFYIPELRKRRQKLQVQQVIIN
ncbi:unnamed protein product [Rotaria sp. Silwood2]|nr:unnamed protein product [Rotaria sp. Silwood2]